MENRQPAAPLLGSASASSFLPSEEFTCSLSDGFPEHVEHRNQEQSDTTRGDHADEHRRADGVPRDLRCAGRPDQRHQSEDECDRCHQHGAESHLGAESCGLLKAQPLLTLFLGELNDEDGVLRRQRNQNDEPDLCIKIERRRAIRTPPIAPNTPTTTENSTGIGMIQLS